MITWEDEAFVLKSKKFGEKDAFVTFLSKEHGKFNAIVKYGISKKIKSNLILGSCVDILWKSKTEDSLGTVIVFEQENNTNHALLFLKPICYKILYSSFEIIMFFIIDFQKIDGIYDDVKKLILNLNSANIFEIYCKWELSFLKKIGYGLALNKCAVSNTSNNLCYVSPKTGRAVSFDVGYAYRKKLLKLPVFLINDDKANLKDVTESFLLFGFFFNKILKEMFISKKFKARTELFKSIKKLTNFNE